MNFDLDDDQLALRDGTRALCGGRLRSERIRKGFDRDMFEELEATGVFSLRDDGFGWADAAVAFEELGRAVVPGPLVWSTVAHGLVGGVVAGVEAPDRDRMVLFEHLATAESVVVLDERGVARLAPDELEEADALARPLDPLTPVHRAHLRHAGERIAGPEVAGEWRRAGAVLTAAFQVGMAQACAEAATRYSLDRVQFDRPIGSFQAVKHLLADMAVRGEVARAAVHAAAVNLDDPDVGDGARAIAGACLLAGRAALENAKGSLQVHGGLGFTWECDVHLYLKRAWVLNATFGSPAEHADALAARL